MEEMIERVLRALLHPRMMMASFAGLHLYVGVATLAYPPDSTLRFAPWFVFVGVFAGIVGFHSVARPTRFNVAMSGSFIFLASLLRASATFDRLLDSSLPEALRATGAIATAQWLTLAYLSYVVWRRLVVPWSVLNATERRKNPR